MTDTLNELGFAEAMKAYASITEPNNIAMQKAIGAYLQAEHDPQCGKVYGDLTYICARCSAPIRCEMRLLTGFNISDEDAEKLRKELHYPDCWDTAAYPSLFDALYEIARCSECQTKREPQPAGGLWCERAVVRQRSPK